MPDDEDSAVPGGKGIDGLILDYQKLGQQAGGQPGGVKQNGRYSSKLGGQDSCHRIGFRRVQTF